MRNYSGGRNNEKNNKEKKKRRMKIKRKKRKERDNEKARNRAEEEKKTIEVSNEISKTPHLLARFSFSFVANESIVNVPIRLYFSNLLKIQ